MNTNLPIVLNDIPLGLDKAFFDQYQSFDEKQDLYAELKKAAAASSWMQADFFKYLWEETNEKTLEKFAQSVNENSATVNSYIRTAQGFPQDNRNPEVTFSHHFQACFADPYDSKTKQFEGTTRNEWLEKAVDQRWTTRQLNEEIMRTKKIKELGTPISCDYSKCSQSGDVFPVNFYNRQAKQTDHFNFHTTCFNQLKEYAIKK